MSAPAGPAGILNDPTLALPLAVAFAGLVLQATCQPSPQAVDILHPWTLDPQTGEELVPFTTFRHAGLVPDAGGRADQRQPWFVCMDAAYEHARAVRLQSAGCSAEPPHPCLGYPTTPACPPSRPAASP